MTDRERILGEIATLSMHLEALHRELGFADQDGSDRVGVFARGAEKLDAAPIARKAPVYRGNGTGVMASAAGAETDTSEHGLPAIAPSDPRFFERYIPGDSLGQGGMGEVNVCKDTRVGRSVAMKVIRPEIAKNKKLRARFLFEAQIQGQLEHPSIVPVYDLGVRPDGYEYFTMKRVRGRTLYEVLRDLHHGDRGAATVWWTRRRLLGAFLSVCQAVEYAHQRGVIHRDLKPSNVMLGDFGEVSILDWGLAKATPRAGAPMLANAPIAPRRRGDETAIGEVLGTPGYMSPEQAADSQSADEQSDVFALGSILFEILTHRPLVPGKTPKEVARTTLTGKFERSITKRFPEIEVPPELEAIVVKATAPSTKERYLRAREIADGVEQFLEGDRDLSKRRSIASGHAREATAALAESARATGTEVARAARTRAIREVNHALAIDPQNQLALRTMMKLVTDVPAVVPPEAEATARSAQTQSRRRLARRGALAYLGVCGNLLMTAWLGVASPLWLAAASGFFLAAAAIAFGASRKEQPGSTFGYPVAALTSCGIAIASAFFGPFIYVPGLCAANVVVFSGADRRLRWTAMAGGVLAILVPLGLELTGVVPAAWSFHDGAITILPRVVELPEIPTLSLLTVAALLTTTLPVLLVGSERDGRAKAELDLAIRAYQLAELLPAEVKVADEPGGKGRPAA